MTDPEPPNDAAKPAAPAAPAPPEPAKAAPPKPEAAKPEPIKAEPTKPEPSKPEPSKPELPKSEPPKRELPRADPIKTAPEPPRALPPPRPERAPLAVLTALGFLLTFVAVIYLWQASLARPDAVDPARLASLESQVRQLQQRVDALERRPAPTAAPDLRPLEARIAALEQRPAPGAPAPAPDLGPIEARVSAAEAQSRRALALQAAAVALEAGRPLGTIPGAPPALSRFATAAPPTLAGLRQDFAAAAAAALEASRPAEPDGFAARIWQRAAGLVTVRRGAEVLVGSPAAYTLGTARQRLDTGDLAGAIAALDGLDPAAAAAMAGWRAKAQSVLDARAALAAG